MTPIEEIAAERKRQIEVEGWTHEHDDEHRYGEISRAAAAYALSASDDKPLQGSVAVGFAGQTQPAGTFFLTALIWPWAQRWWKPKTRRDRLIKAGALIVAEIERIDRLTAKGNHP